MNSRITYIALILIVLTSLSCRKDVSIPVDCCSNPNQVSCSGMTYNNFSTDDFEQIIKPVDNPGAVIGPFIFDNFKYSVGGAIMSPTDPYLIAYGKSDSGSTSITGELWTFDFCDGKSELVTTNAIDRLDWSTKNWLLYTGTGYEVYKVKSNGDSLTQLTNGSGTQLAGKWSPDGTKFWVEGQDAFKILDENGSSIIEYPGLPNFDAIDWLDNEHLLIVDYNTDIFSSFNFLTSDIVQLSGGPICHSCQKIYDSKNQRVFVGQENGGGGFDWYIFNLENGSSSVIENLDASFHYYAGDYVEKTDKLSLVLRRMEWKDSVQNEIYSRDDLLIMNPDGSGKRLVQLPH